jgi:hypothetical protein
VNALLSITHPLFRLSEPGSIRQRDHSPLPGAEFAVSTYRNGRSESNRHARRLPDTTDDSPRYETLEVYIVRRDGGGLQRITTNTYFDGHPSW